jgi:hypothetical protein
MISTDLASEQPIPAETEAKKRRGGPWAWLAVAMMAGSLAGAFVWNDHRRAPVPPPAAANVVTAAAQPPPPAKAVADLAPAATSDRTPPTSPDEVRPAISNLHREPKPRRPFRAALPPDRAVPNLPNPPVEAAPVQTATATGPTSEASSPPPPPATAATVERQRARLVEDPKRVKIVE